MCVFALVPVCVWACLSVCVLLTVRLPPAVCVHTWTSVCAIDIPLYVCVRSPPIPVCVHTLVPLICVRACPPCVYTHLPLCACVLAFAPCMCSRLPLCMCDVVCVYTHLPPVCVCALACPLWVRVRVRALAPVCVHLPPLCVRLPPVCARLPLYRYVCARLPPVCVRERACPLCVCVRELSSVKSLLLDLTTMIRITAKLNITTTCF